jgi:hypothetical protein
MPWGKWWARMCCGGPYMPYRTFHRQAADLLMAPGLRSFPGVGGLRCHLAPQGVPIYPQKYTTSVVRGHPPTYRKVRHSVNLVLNLVLRRMHTKFSTVVGGPTSLQKCTTSVVRGDPPTYKNVRRWHRNPPTPGKERNPAVCCGVPWVLFLFVLGLVGWRYLPI